MEYLTMITWCIFFIFGALPFARAKTVDVLLSSEEALRETGQLITSFTFTGGGPTAIRYHLGAKPSLEPRIFMFSSELLPRRRHVNDNASCHKFLELAVSTFRLRNLSGELRPGSFTGPFRVALIYGDALTCGQQAGHTTPAPTRLAVAPAGANAVKGKQALSDDRVKDNGRSLMSVKTAVKMNKGVPCHLELFNADSFGEPTNHFGAEEIGLLGFFQVLTLCLFIAACISVPKLWPHLAPSAGGSMRSVITLTTAIAGLQFLSYLLIMIHLQHYSRNGVEGRFCEALAELLDLCCQFLMLHLLFCWSFATRRHEERVWSGPVFRGVVGLASFQIISFLFGELLYPSDEHVYHNYNGSLQLILLLVRVMLASSCALYLLKASKRDRSPIKRDFFTVFSKICLVWFLCYPVIYVGASMWREYTRYKLTTMAVCLSQTGCLLLLYRLFISRSLFWEVSALSGTLPIVMKFDKKYGLKASP